MLEVQNLCKSFGSLAVLQGVDLQVETGDVISILGPSGSGKTTLLRCLNFLERADEGLLRFDGAEYAMHKAGKKEIAAIRQKTAFVFQNYNLFRNKNALQNVTEGLVAGRHMPKAEAVERGQQALAKVGMADRAAYYPHQLSGGQQQRVAIARALALEPDILCFDEPTSALDPELTGEVLRVIKGLKGSDRTIIIVTHEMEFAKSISDRVIFMADGIIEEDGTPEQVFCHPQSAKTQQFLSSSLEHF